MLMFQAWPSCFSAPVGLLVSAHTGDQPSLPSGLTTSLLISVMSYFPVLSFESKTHFYIGHPIQEKTDLGILFLLLDFLPQALEPDFLCPGLFTGVWPLARTGTLRDCMGLLHTPLAISFEEWQGHPGWLPSSDDFASEPWQDEPLLWLVFRAGSSRWSCFSLASDFSLFPWEGRNGP